MTTEPRQEAENILLAHEQRVHDLVRGHGSPEEYGAAWRHLADTLAAAIEVDAKHSGDPNLCCLAAAPCAHTRLAWALSALRGAR